MPNLPDAKKVELRKLAANCLPEASDIDSLKFQAAASPSTVTALLEEVEEVRNCTICVYCGTIERHLESWDKKVDSMLAHIEVCEKSPMKQLLNMAEKFVAAEAERDRMRELLRQFWNANSLGLEILASDESYILAEAALTERGVTNNG